MNEMTFRTVPQLAQEEHVSRPTVYNWIRAGRLQSTRVGGQHRINEQQWAEFLARCNKK